MDTRLLSEYFKKCFVAVDGLWFMMVEEADSFDKALEIDRRVWEIVPKIQARKIKELLEIKDPTQEDLITAIKFKLDAEDFVSTLDAENGRIRVTIRECPWVALLKKTNREHVAEHICDAICSLEYRVFAKEFVETVDINVESRLSCGDKVCSIVLTVCS